MLKKGSLSFQSSQSRIPCTFLYPAGWDIREIVEDGYVEIFILGPVSRAGSYSTSLSVGVTRAAGQTPARGGEYADFQISRCFQGPGARPILCPSSWKASSGSGDCLFHAPAAEQFER